MSDILTARQRQILDCIVEHQTARGYPPSVREIGEAVGLKSPATVKSHLDNLKEAGYLVRDPAKPRAHLAGNCLAAGFARNEITSPEEAETVFSAWQDTDSRLSGGIS